MGRKKIEYEKAMEAARKRVAGMDEADARMGFATPRQAGIRGHLGAIHSALECAITLGDWGVAAEAQVMVEQILAGMPAE